MSSSVHVGSSSRVANNCGYLETSSKPVGVLKSTSIIAVSVYLIHNDLYHSENRCSTLKFVSAVSYQWKQFYDLRVRLSVHCVCQWNVGKLPPHRYNSNCFIEPSIDNDYSLNARCCAEDTRKIITNLSRRNRLLFQRDRSPPPFECDWCVLKQHGRP